MYLDGKAKRIFGIACLAKKSYYYSKVRASGPLKVHPPAPLRRQLVGFPPAGIFCTSFVGT